MPDPLFAHRHVKLTTLVGLRWLSILGQSLAVLTVWLVLDYHFDAVLCLLLLAVSALLNLLLQFLFRKSVRLSPLQVSALLAFDSVQLGVQLYLTGGMQNPFALLLMMPAVISTAMQTPRSTVFLSGLITLIASFLVFVHEPLPWASEAPPDFPVLYIFGTWTGIIITMLFLSIYTFRIAKEGHLLSDALAATELMLANEQHLSDLDGLATAAAHELGTPLNTIQLVAKELRRDLEPESPLQEDMALLCSQVERCRQILSKLRSLSGEDHGNFTKMKLDALIDEIVAPFEDLDIQIDRIFPEDLTNQPVLKRNPGLLFGLGNLVENAVDFAKSRVILDTRWNENGVILTIADDGPGFSEDILSRLGEPYVTTRGQKSQGVAQGIANASSEPNMPGPVSPDSMAGGLGLGFFIAKTLLERGGAKVRISNNKTKVHTPLQKKSNIVSGAVIEIFWTRSMIEADQ